LRNQHFRPFAAIGHHLKMLQRGPSLRPFVPFAAFLLAETSVCGQSDISLRQHE
jgi:hypothetical protein